MENFDFIFRRTHEHYKKNRSIWERSRAAYAGGESYLAQALVRHVSEIELEYLERLARGYYFNYPRKIARLITQYLLSVEPQRKNTDTSLIEDFSRSGLRTNEVMRQFSTLLNLYGRAGLVIEMPYFKGAVDAERKIKEKLRPAVKALSPLEMVDYAYGDDGRLSWMLVEECDTLDAGPFMPPVPVKRRKLYTRDEILVFERDSVTSTAVLLSKTKHSAKQVPVVMLDEPDSFGLSAGHYFEDVIRISDAILNHESEAQMNIIKQMFGLLVISDSFARSGRGRAGSNTPQHADERFSHILARSAALYETPEEKGISRYISPSGVETQAIRNEIETLKQELFDIVGMTATRNINQAQTAESKSWDYHNVRQFLSSRVDVLEQAEINAWKIMHACDKTVPIPEVIYNRDFAVVDLERSIAALLQLDKITLSKEYHREIARTGLFLLEKIKKIPPDSRKIIEQEITESENRHA